MGRGYKKDGVSYPSVTTITGQIDNPDPLIYWAVNCALKYIENSLDEDGEFMDDCTIEDVLKEAKFKWREVGKEAMDIGSEIHKLIENYIKFGKDAVGKLRPEVENGFLAFLEWEEHNVIKWIQSEQSVFSLEYGFAGTLDATAVLYNPEFPGDKNQGMNYVIDFKSSKDFYQGYGMQVCGYRLAVLEHGFPAQGAGVLRLDKETGLPAFKDYTPDLEKKTRAFLKLVDFYYSHKKRRLANNPFVQKYWPKAKKQ